MDQRPPLTNSTDQFDVSTDRPPATPEMDTSEVSSNIVTSPKKGMGAKMLVIGAVVLLAMVAAAGGVYAWQHAKVTDLSGKVASLTKEVDSLKDQLEAQKSASPSVFDGINARARDTERQTDINALQGHIEAYYAYNGYYPRLADINDATWRAINMRGLDEAALNDPSDDTPNEKLVAAPIAGAYAYAISDDNNVSCEASATSCTKYTLTATFETTVTGSKTYAKTSL